ncbi:hypothetical protein [Rossellomorea yichunensis]|uniref:hypothetical protein n=1 Tax=Rossellomorea yichunensis TaxID=3077331 RepID=UPI0028EAFA2F|nr:hypothetical protein [Rossellomorea sp. YC4-1]
MALVMKIAFEWGQATLGILNVFPIGSLTEWKIKKKRDVNDSAKQQLPSPVQYGRKD